MKNFAMRCQAVIGIHYFLHKNGMISAFLNARKSLSGHHAKNYVTIVEFNQILFGLKT